MLLGITFSLPVVQTKIGVYATDWLQKKYKADIKVARVSLTIFGGIKLKNIMIKDHHKDTLIYANRIKTNVLNIKKLSDGDLFFGDISIDSLFFNLKLYKGEKQNNINTFVALFDDGKPSKKPFLLQAKNVYLRNSRFVILDENLDNPKNLDFSRINISLNNFKIFDADVFAKINKLSFKDHRGLFLKNLETQFAYTKTNIILDHFSLQTKFSKLDGNAVLRYKDNDFATFNDKVIFDLKLNNSLVGTNDIRYFNRDIEKNLVFEIKSNIKGTLNDLDFESLYLKNQKTVVSGDLNLTNSFGDLNQHFLLTANLDQLTTNHQELVELLPNVLGKKLPMSIKKLGQFDFKGTVKWSQKALETAFFLKTALGNVSSKLKMNHIDQIENATYIGNVVMEQFKLGSFLDQKNIDQVSLNFDIDGKGFSTKSLNSKASGRISKLWYNHYLYSNIVVNGNFKSPIFNGKVNINDPNLFMDFEGLVDFSKNEKKYDFHTKIDYANLNKLQFVKDSISVFKGDIKMNISGNSLDNMIGKINISQTFYQNQNDTFVFDDLELESFFDEQRVRTINIHSPDIIEGKIVGQFQFDQLQKMVENAAGSLYANYDPNTIKKGQFLKFNFSIYNKIIEIFYPGIIIGANTVVKGNINADQDEFKLNFTSPNIKAFENNFDKIKVEIDNKNPLYNAYIEVDSIKTKHYKISDFSLINVTANDTLFVRSEFKGGQKADDYYNLNLYHTIDLENNSVVGIHKSELKFKDYLWFLNEDDNRNNRIVFDKKLKNFSIEKINLTHQNQQISLLGKIQDSTFKDLELDFRNVNLGKILPAVDSLKIAGNLNGKINFKQKNAIYQPTSALNIDSLHVNNIKLGSLNLDIIGDNDFKQFAINSSLENENLKSFLANGNFLVANKKTILDLDLKFNSFNLSPFSPIGGNVISNIRGFISGNTKMSGSLDNPDFLGKVYLQKAGLKVPYLNVDFDFNENAEISIFKNQFVFQNSTLTDLKYKTIGKLNGKIKHKNFSNWDLDLVIQSNKFLALDTKDSENAAYYGTAFIDGKATIIGPTNSLLIAVDAKSRKGTEIKIPINNSESTGNKNFLHFLSPKEKFNLQNGIVGQVNNYNGLELKFELDLTPEAEIEVILDRETAHGMKGKGNGTLLLEINTLGKFNMYGDFQVYEGFYNFKYKSLIDKKFEVKKFSSISWEGDPLRARLDLEAVYNVPAGANPAVLLDNPSVNKKVPVEVAITITGNLSSPEPDFNINFPKISSVLKSEIQTKLSDKDIRQTQALTLLATGGFLSQDGINQSTVYNNLLSEKAGSLFDGLFQNQSDKLKVALDIATADKTPGKETNGSIALTLSTQINERLSLNGKLGVPIGGLSETAFVGNFELQYRVNDDGTLNFRVFNRENDINYIGEGIGYTQGFGINYEVDFDSFKELIDKILKTKTLSKSEPIPTPNSQNKPPNQEADKPKN